MPSDSTSDQLDLGILLALAYDSFVTELNAHLADQGYNDLGRSFGYVARLLDAREARVSEIAELLGLTNQGAVKILDQLETARYVTRAVDPSDGRARRVQLTSRGREALTAARAFHRSYEQRLASEGGARSAATFRTVLTDLASRGPGELAARRVRPI